MRDLIEEMLKKTGEKNISIYENPSRELLIQKCIDRKEVYILKSGTLASITPNHSTGRSPKDTVTVKRDVNETALDWDSQYNIPISPETFEMLLEDAFDMCLNKKELFITERSVGADPSYSMSIKSISSKALNSLFTLNMFRPPVDYSNSIFKDEPFYLLMLPNDYLNPDRYKGRLRINPETGKTTNMAIA
ncbi:MAG TPA: phosphoenolpyruvate carboxykinase (ATP), partial [Exilispira sp.]|nr:phosphoenolpyruvate carboxykinase (ATP) [Exilispira sp.]